ncbi:MAG: OadG family protein [Elusimicrobiaceae bacterium]|nr:OadG family protein [Elusimicrobiaceae bacterium]
MNAENLMMSSVYITIIGTLTVFVFLFVMIWIMNGMSLLVKVMEKYFPQQVPQQKAAASADNALVAIAIAAAKRFQGK